jgi:hypothetical protein
MSTVTRESTPTALPSVGRGETLFGLLAIVVGLLSLLAKFSGLFS